MLVDGGLVGDQQLLIRAVGDTHDVHVVKLVMGDVPVFNPGRCILRILAVLIAVPPIEEQKMIGAFVRGKADELAALTAPIRQQIDTLTNYLRLRKLAKHAADRLPTDKAGIAVIHRSEHIDWSSLKEGPDPPAIDYAVTKTFNSASRRHVSLISFSCKNSGDTIRILRSAYA